MQREPLSPGHSPDALGARTTDPYLRVVTPAPSDEISHHDVRLEPPARAEATRGRPQRAFDHLLAGGVAGLVVGCADGYMAATREGLEPLDWEAHRSSILLSVTLTVTVFALAGLAFGTASKLLGPATRRWLSPRRAVAWLVDSRRAGWVLGAGLLLGGAFGWLTHVKGVEWSALDLRLPVMVLMAGCVHMIVARVVRGWTLEQVGVGVVAVAGLMVVSAAGYHDLAEVRSAALERLGTESAVSGRILLGIRGAFDRDGDGHPSTMCAQDCDCDDGDASVFPGAMDVPGNGVDEDCDGLDATREEIEAVAARFQKPVRRDTPAEPVAPAAAELALPEDDVASEPVVMKPAAPPNFVFVVVDTLRADHLGVYGYERATSPKLDAFAEQAVVFDHARAAGSQTRFSVPPMLVGKYFTEIGRTDGQWPSVLEDETLIAEHLKGAGYDTAAVHSISYFRQWSGMAQGFDSYDVNCVLERSPWRTHRTSDCVTDRALGWADEKLAQPERSGKPFMLWAYYGDPHAPYLRHPDVDDFGSSYPDRYDEEIVFTDRHLGRLLDGLEQRGMLENTVVVITSDHGEGLDEQEDHGHRFHGPTLYDEVIRVPLIVRGPGLQPGRVQRSVSLIDLAPTFLDLAGLEPSPDHRGVPLTPWLRGEDPDHPPVFFEKHKETALPQKGVVDWPYKLIMVMPYNRIKIYDLEKDPRERNEIKRELPDEEVRRLVTLLKYWSGEILQPRKPVPSSD